MLTIILPTINEAQSLPSVVHSIRLHAPDSEIIVVDDGSTDSTPDLAHSLDCTVLSRPSPLGIISAFTLATFESHGTHLVLMDADGQHPASLLPLMQSLSATYDLVVASRHTPSSSIPDWSLPRRLISDGAIHLTHFFLPSTHTIRDITSGYFMVSRQVALTTHFHNPRGWKVLPELISQHPSLSMVEVSYVFQPRLYGHSKLKTSTIITYLRHLISIRERFRL